MFFLPGWCFQCRRFIYGNRKSAAAYLCQSCRQKLPLIKKPLCLKCGSNHPSENCREKWPRHISGFRAIFTHQDPIRQWIAALKYQRNFAAGRILRGALTEWLRINKSRLNDIDFIIPSPIHPLRLRRRGFNQVEYLLSEQKQLPVENSIIKKARYTPYQAGLSRFERIKYIKGAFKASRSLSGKKVLLFDDVCASGGTMEEISGCLRRAGAERIQALALSRAV